MKRLSYDTIMRLKLWRMPVHGMFPKFFWYRVWKCLMPQECIEETDLFNEIIKLKSCQSTSH
jgi:hypothetical protein